MRALVLGLTVCAVGAAAVPAAASAGSISGKVTAEDGGAPIGGVAVCQYEPNGAIEESCTQSNASGDYAFDGLPAGSYVIGFTGWQGNLKWVDEIYDDRRYSFEADQVTIAAAEARTGVDATLAEGGSIEGTVIDENTKSPIADIWVCAIDDEGIPARCASTDSDGEYRLNGLRSDEYSVELDGGNKANYLHEFYEDASTWAGATAVSVVAPSVTLGIDAEMASGAQVLGRVTELGSGAPLENVFVCALEVAPGEYQACDSTGPDGAYAIRSLPAGTYLVAFEREYLPFFGWTAGQWWEGASSEADATPIAIAPPETRGGIDGEVAGPYRTPDGGPTPVPSPPPILTTSKRPIAVAGAMAQVRRGRALIRLRCPGESVCRGALRLFARANATSGGAKRSGRRARNLAIGGTRFSVPAGRRALVRVRLNRKGKALLRRSGKRGLRVRLVSATVKNRSLVLRSSGKRKQRTRRAGRQVGLL